MLEDLEFGSQEEAGFVLKHRIYVHSKSAKADTDIGKDNSK